MRTDFLAAVDVALAGVVRVVPVSDEAPGWGSDLYCADDIDPEFTEVDGDDPKGVALYTYRRITTAPGELPDDPDWGVNVFGRLSSAMGDADMRQMQSEAFGEISQDDRLQDVDVQVSYDLKSESCELKVFARLVDSGETFLLTAVSDADGSRLVELIVDGQPAT